MGRGHQFHPDALMGAQKVRFAGKKGLTIPLWTNLNSSHIKRGPSLPGWRNW